MLLFIYLKDFLDKIWTFEKLSRPNEVLSSLSWYLEPEKLSAGNNFKCDLPNDPHEWIFISEDKKKTTKMK